MLSEIVITKIAQG